MARVLSLVLVAEADRAVGRIGIFVLSRDAARRIAASIAKAAVIGRCERRRHLVCLHNLRERSAAEQSIAHGH